MVRALAFLVKVGLLVALAVWIADRPGFVRIEWMNYAVTIQVGFFLLLALATILLSIFIFMVMNAFVHFPKSFRRYREIKRHKSGYRALTLGLAAVAAGDGKNAQYQAHRAHELLSGDDGLPLLLKAQSERLQGQEEAAQKTFASLTENKDAAFLGVRGLLQAALDARNHQKALELARKALQMYPRQPWILKLVYDLEIKQRNWEEAQIILYRAEKAGSITAAQALSDRIAIFMARAQKSLDQGFREKAHKNLQQSYKYGQFFVPAAVNLAKFYKDEGNRRKAMAIVLRIWRKNPHPDLSRLWESLLPPHSASKPMARLLWAEKLVAVNTAHPESYLFAGRVAMEESLWGEAREFFRKAETIEPSARLYWLWANLEKRTGGNQRVIQMLQDKATSFPPDRCWVCCETGRIYEQWTPIAEPHGSFNTIQWEHPHGPSPRLLGAGQPVSDFVIEAPRYSDARS